MLWFSVPRFNLRCFNPFRILSSGPGQVAGAVLLVGCALSTSPAFGSKDSVPDWVRAAAAQPLAVYPPSTDAVVLLDETTLTVGADGKAVEHHRHVVKILRPSGRDQGYVHVEFDNDSKILSLHVWSIGPDGHEYAVKDNEMAEMGLPGQGNFYEDLRVKRRRRV